MERITSRTCDGVAYVRSETGTEGVGHFTTQRRLPEIITKLAAYEDTGLTPEECNLYVKCEAQKISKRELGLSMDNALLKRKFDEANISKYIIIYHDKRGLYDDVLVIVADEVNDGSLEQNFKRMPDVVVKALYGFDDDGWWEAKKIERINSIPRISYAE